MGFLVSTFCGSHEVEAQRSDYITRLRAETTQGLYRDDKGLMEKKMETIIIG